jgi:hypothetical protein
LVSNFTSWQPVSR